MAKKKSKTQKYKKKLQKANTKSSKTKSSKSVIKENNTKTKSSITSANNSRRIVDKDKVKYNVVFTEKTLKQIDKTTNNKSSKKKDYSKILVQFFRQIIRFFNELCSNIKKMTKKIFNKLSNQIIKIKTKKIKVIKKKTSKKNIKQHSKKEEFFSKNPATNILVKIKKNIHIIFNAALIITYIVLLTGLMRTGVFSKGTIIYISCIVIFLMIVAIGYNKYISGKIYSILIIIGMSLAIYQMQYTYDFFRNLNTNQYEYKEYYVVTFNNGRNKSIYNINNKKVGLLKENSTNIERILDIKLDNINYIEYDDPNLLYSDFYNQKYRAIIVNENQYKYLKNNIEPNSRSVKILYKFKANGKK